MNKIIFLTARIAAVTALAGMMAAGCTGCGSSKEEQTYQTDLTSSEAETEESIDLDDNPGFFDNDYFYIEYDTEKFYGFVVSEDPVAVLINYTGECAGSTYLEVSKYDCTNIEDAITQISEASDHQFEQSETVSVNGCNVAYIHHSITDNTDTLTIDEYYKIFEKDGNVVVINQEVPRDSDSKRADIISDEFDDVISTLTVK